MTDKTENAVLIKEGGLNGCFGDLYVSKTERCLFCVCNTQNVRDTKDCPFFERDIDIKNYELQIAGFGLSGKYELGNVLKQEYKK